MAKQKEKKAVTRSKSEDGIEPPSEGVAPRLKLKYHQELKHKLMKDLGFSNVMRVPRLVKIVVNAGLGRSTQNIKIIELALKDIGDLTGQKPVSTKSKAAISNFKLRQGLPIGVMVTLRGDRMWEFLDRIISLTLPRIRDFRGVSERGFDGRGNFTMGMKDHLVFPEVRYDTLDSSFGMNISIVTTANTDEEGRKLLTELGIPFRKKSTQKAA
jgi:large subunit ribosomal protein L5